MLFVFFFKQKTAYELRISDWSSDVCSSDLKSNEYANLIGGEQYEPHEENPMIGFRGASRYVDPSFADCFALECQAMRKVRDEMGLTNAWVMIPFVRTLGDGRKVIQTLAKNGLERGVTGLKKIGRASCRERVWQYV